MQKVSSKLILEIMYLGMKQQYGDGKPPHEVYPDIYAFISSAFLSFLFDMSLPAKAQTIEEPLLAPPFQLDTNQVVRNKYQTFKDKGDIRITLTRQYPPANLQLHQTRLAKFKELIQKTKEADNPDVDQFLPLIFGVLEGSSGLGDPMLLLIHHFGDNFQFLRVEEMVKERTKVVNYGVDKRKGMSVLQVDKKTLDSLSELYDTKAIKNHRKTCIGIRNYIKSWKKFKSSVESSDQHISETSEAYRYYADFVKEEVVFNTLQISTANIEPLIEENIEEPLKNATTPLKQKQIIGKKDDTAQSNKNKTENDGLSPDKEKEGKTKVRRSKQDKEKEKILKEQERQEKKRIKEEKERQKQIQKEKQKAEKIQKERLKQQEKEKQRRIKQQEKQAKQKQKLLQKQAKECERLAKQEQKRKKEEQKEKKSIPGKSLLTWFKPIGGQEDHSPQKSDKMEEEEPSQHQESIGQSQKESFLTMIRSQNTALPECRQEFFFNKMRDQSSNFQPYYTTIFTHKSRLQFSNFFVAEQRLSNYILPHEETDIGKYDDSSVEYEDLCGDVCNEDVDAISDEDGSQDNSAIVPDSYFQVGELSEESKDDVVVNIDQGGEWCVQSGDQRSARYEMFCLFEQTFPLSMSEPEESKQIPVLVKCQLYRVIHGYHGTKDVLVKELALIIDNVPKSFFFSLIRETTTKRNNQRLVKPEIIEFLNEQSDGFMKELEEIKERRDEEIRNTVREKVNEKERQLERLILEEAGTYYVVDLLQFLREKGYRMPKKDLIAFIDGRQGSHWDDIRRRMSKMTTAKERQKMNQFLLKKEEEKEKQPSDHHPSPGGNIS